MPRILYANNATTQLSAPTGVGDTSLLVVAGAVFPTPTGGDIAYLTLANGGDIEVVKMTARAGNVLTVERAQDGTVSKAFSAGTQISLRITRAGLTDFYDKNDAASLTAAWASVTGKPATFPPSAHAHVVGDVTGLQALLDNKAAFSHTHIIGDVTGLQTALDGKAATSHTHIIGDVTGLQTALDGKASLTGATFSGAVTLNGAVTLPGGIKVGGGWQAGSLAYTDSNWGMLNRPPVAGAIAAHGWNAFDGTQIMSLTEAGVLTVASTIGAAGATFSGTVSLNSSNQINFLNANYFIRASTGLELQSGDLIRFLTGGANERMRITSAGNVGIGHTNPTAKLQVLGGAYTIPAAGGGTNVPVIIHNNDTGYGLLLGTTGGGHGWLQAQRVDGTATTYSLLLQPNGGNVGIGTISPTYKLEVHGTHYWSGDGTWAGGTQRFIQTVTTGIGNVTGGLGRLEVFNISTGAAFMTFHRSGNYAAYFGLDTDNQWKVGGWSAGAVAHKIWHAGNDGAGSGLDADLLGGKNLVDSADTINTVAGRNGAGDIFMRLPRTTYADQSTISGGIVFRINNSTDNYLRVCNSPSAIATYLGLGTASDVAHGSITAKPGAGSVTSGTLTAAGNANRVTLLVGNITVPANVFVARDICILVGGSAARTITRGASVTMYVKGVDVASATLSARGNAGIVWESATVCYITGDVS